jgi:hypothetical protein
MINAIYSGNQSKTKTMNKISNCCGARPYLYNTLLFRCNDCKEHCTWETIDLEPQQIHSKYLGDIKDFNDSLYAERRRNMFK